MSLREFVHEPTGIIFIEVPRPEGYDKPLCIAKYPVTRSQWESVMGNDPSKNERDVIEMLGAENDYPVENVSWDDCQEFCRKTGLRLPSEMEWEYCCRAGSTTKWYFGDDESQLGEHAWYSENSGGRTHPVGMKKPNAWGLHDTSGLVWEWTASKWRDKPAAALRPSEKSSDPTLARRTGPSGAAASSSLPSSAVRAAASGSPLASGTATSACAPPDDEKGPDPTEASRSSVAAAPSPTPRAAVRSTTAGATLATGSSPSVCASPSEEKEECSDPFAWRAAGPIPGAATPISVTLDSELLSSDELLSSERRSDPTGSAGAAATSATPGSAVRSAATGTPLATGAAASVCASPSKCSDPTEPAEAAASPTTPGTAVLSAAPGAVLAAGAASSVCAPLSSEEESRDSTDPTLSEAADKKEEKCPDPTDTTVAAASTTTPGTAVRRSASGSTLASGSAASACASSSKETKEKEKSSDPTQPARGTGSSGAAAGAAAPGAAVRRTASGATLAAGTTTSVCASPV